MASPLQLSDNTGERKPIDKEYVQLLGTERNKNKLAFVLYNVLTKEECDHLIKKTEKKGYEEALVNIGCGRQKKMTDIRNSSRCIIDDAVYAEELWQRIKTYIPEVFQDRRVLGLNERLRFLRYDPGEYFKPHCDGAYRRDNGETSRITLQLYLNEGFKGGATNFLYDGGAVPVIPKTGSILIFQHDIFHEGEELKQGRKYAMRTDIMYSADRMVLEG